MIAADVEPVSALRAPSVRVLGSLPIVALITAGSLIYFGLRTDSSALGWWLTWTSSALQLALGLTLFVMVLREAVPGARLPQSLIFAMGSFALALLMGVYVTIWLSSPMDGRVDFFSAWWACFRGEYLLGVPLFAAITYLAARALPARPATVGLLAGLGSGVIVDASWRLVCPLSAPSHFLAAHVGGILALGGAGFLLGRLYEGWQIRSRRTIGETS